MGGEGQVGLRSVLVPAGMIPCPRPPRRVYALAMRWLHSDQILQLFQAIAIAWPVPLLGLALHTPQPTPPVDDDDDDDDHRGGGSSGGNIDPDDDEGLSEDEDDEEDDEGDTLWTGADARSKRNHP